MTKILYIASSSFSGSTLLSFLLNTHPGFFTVGHTGGWHYEKGQDFFCSCGKKLEECPFFRAVAEAFGREGVPFEFWNFGTRYRAMASERWNRLLLYKMRFCSSSRLELLRDALVRLNPVWRRAIARQDLANEVFVGAALAYSGASVYVDNGHNPFRLRQLGRIPRFELTVVHLVRDLRGVVYSYRKNHGWDIESGTRMWLQEQADAVRILREFDRTVTMRYEDLCESLDDTVSRLHRFVGLDPRPVPEDFGSQEHHILGNVMRLRDKRVVADVRWRSELSPEELKVIGRTASRFVARGDGRMIAEMVDHYLGGGEVLSGPARR